MKERVNLGFGDALQDFDPKEWQPEKSGTANDRASKTVANEAAKAAGFRSREPKVTVPSVPVLKQVPMRRRRTGRNAQFNLKARPETIEAFCEIADRQGWGLGETLEQAVALLEREYPS